MPLANLMNVPSSAAELDAWSFAHMAQHRDTTTALLAQFSVTGPGYILDPLNPGNVEFWEQQHQLMHNAVNQALGIDGNNLTDSNWTNLAARAVWIQLNFNEHQLWCRILGLG